VQPSPPRAVTPLGNGTTLGSSGWTASGDWNTAPEAPPGHTFVFGPAPTPMPTPTPAPLAVPRAFDESRAALPGGGKQVPGRSARLPVVLGYLGCAPATAKRLREEEYDTRSIFLSCHADFLEMGISPEDAARIADWATQVEMAEDGA
jgi:hypothetical protein